MEPIQIAASRTRMSTGIGGLDEVIDGGLPLGGITVVVGGAGTGKTTFGLQVLAKGARDGSDPGILVAFEESAARIVANASGFEWAGEQLRTDHLHVIDAQMSQAVETIGDFDLVGLLAIISAKAKQVGARRIVFDGIDVLLNYLGSPALIRREVFRLREWVHQSGLSTIVTAKAGHDGAHAADDYDFLEFMADCVIALSHRVVEGTALRSLRISKYRGASHSSNELPLTLTEVGLEIASHLRSGRAHPAPDERVSTGVDRLDTMLCGGYHRGSSILVTGAPGTAKTTLSAAFAEAAANRGERTLMVSFDEAPEQIVRNVASTGIHLARHVDDGTLQIRGLRARSDNADGHVAHIRSLIRRYSPLNIVIDPLSAINLPGCAVESEAAALQLIDMAKAAGITIFSSSLLGISLPFIEQTPLNISTIADTWMHVSYISHAGERNRALTVIKSRGTAHSNQVRELVLSEGGVTLADVYAVGGEVLTGTLRWQKENEARRARALAQSDASLRERKAEVLLARTKAQVASLTLEQGVQEAELDLIKAAAAGDADHLAGEAGELLQRRGADLGSVNPITFKPPSESAGL